MVKMSGKGLGLTGGTIDKLESIPGMNLKLSKEELIEKANSIGFALSSQTKELTPLDKVIYSLRDVTGTTESIPLIASSIMSKKIALGADNILIDVKFGSGALMKTRDQAKELSRYLTTIGEAYEKNVKTIISPMSTPLSYAIGNALEVAEAINVLHGKECPLYHSCVDIVATLYSMAKGVSIEEAKKEAKKVIITGDALKKFYEFVKAQGGRLGELAISDNVIKVRAQKSGRIDTIDALGAAKLAAKLGASRMKLDDKIDYRVGIMLSVTEGDTVNKGDLLMNLYVKDYNQEFTESDFNFINIVDF
jgi:pyrimidine-nucleoside phosphorylase